MTRRAAPHGAIVLALLALAAILRFEIAPRVSRLPAGYANETRYAAVVRFRQTPDGPWEAGPLVARRVDRTLTVSGDVAIVQGAVQWTTPDGKPTYQTSGVYGVDRRTRANLPGYGDRPRTGQFLFPPRVQPTTYTLWDPYYAGPTTATFHRVDRVDGLAVYVFDYAARELDDTAGFETLPDVPHRYRVHSDGQGTLWVEPVSGVVVDFTDTGVSYFVEPKTLRRVADAYHWTGHYTAETRTARLDLAGATRRTALALEWWLPGGLVLLGLAWAGTVWWLGGAGRPPRPPQETVR